VKAALVRAAKATPVKAALVRAAKATPVKAALVRAAKATPVKAAPVRAVKAALAPVARAATKPKKGRSEQPMFALHRDVRE